MKNKKQRLAENKAKKEAYRKSRERKFHKKAVLREFIKKSIKELVIEQTTADCQQIYALTDPQSNMSFSGCCETTQNWTNWDPTTPDDPCKGIQSQASAISPNFAACCDPNYTGTGTGTGTGNCDDPLWLNVPMNHPSTIDKINYCNRCSETGGGTPSNGTYYVDLNNSTPHYTYNPASGNSWCHCCEPAGCETMLPANHPSCVKCKSNQNAGFPIPPGGTAAGAPGSGDDCECCREDDRNDNPSRCEQMTQGVYDPSGNNPQHNEDWGLGCWFCHPEPEHPDFPNCTVIIGGMTQVNAYAAFTAGTSNIYPTDAGCQADPITKCGGSTQGDMEQCQCCTKGGAISMVQQVTPGNCKSLDNAAMGTYNCQPAPPLGGTIKCKKPGTGIPTNPNVFDKIAPNAGDLKKAVRESIKKLNSAKGKLNK